MSNNKGFAQLLAIGIILAVVVLTLLVVILYQRSTENVEELKRGNTNVVTNVSRNTNTSKRPVVTSWLTFNVEDEGGFSFEYPENWEAKTTAFIQQPGWRHLRNGAAFWFSLDPKEVTAYEYLVNDLGSEEVILDGFRTEKKTSSDATGRIISVNLNFKKGGHLYNMKFEFVADDQLAKESYLAIFDRILASLKFTS